MTDGPDMAARRPGGGPDAPDCLYCLLDGEGEESGPLVIFSMCLKHPQHVVVHGESLLTRKLVEGEYRGGEGQGT